MQQRTTFRAVTRVLAGKRGAAIFGVIAIAAMLIGGTQLYINSHAASGPQWRAAGSQPTHTLPHAVAVRATSDAKLTPAQLAQRSAAREKFAQPRANPFQRRAATANAGSNTPGYAIPAPRQMAPNSSPAPGDGEISQSTTLPSSAICSPDCQVSNVMEPSVAGRGKYLFETGNWFAATSNSGGATWTALDPYSVNPNYCCDQQVIYEPARNVFLWLTMDMDPGDMNTPPTPTGSGNGLQLTVYNGTLSSALCTYTLTSDQFGMAADQFTDFPDIQFSTDDTYITWNTYDPTGATWENSALVRYPTDQIATCQPLSGNYISRSDVFTFTLVSGSTEGMNFASQSCITACATGTQMEFYNWSESAGGYGILTLNLNAYTYLNAGDATCASADGTVTAWCGDADSRRGAGYLSRAGFRGFGGQVIGFAWNAAADASHPFPYVVRNYFVLPTMTYKGSDAMYSANAGLLYPNCADTSYRGYVACAATIGGGTGSGASAADTFPSTLTWIEDKQHQTSPWFVQYTCTGAANAPIDRWGDFTTVRAWSDDLHWVVGSWCMSSTGAVTAQFVILGVVRDHAAYASWIAG